MTTTTKMAMAMYQPKKGKSEELKKILKEHIPTLQKLELITERAPVFLESENGTLIEVFEWTSDAAKDIAHKHPAVRAIWGKMMEICTFPSFKDLPEGKHSFPNFIVSESNEKKQKESTPTLRATTVYYYVSDINKSIKFYTETFGLPLKFRFENRWAEVDAGSITIGLHPTVDGIKPKQIEGGTVSFTVSDLTTTVSELKKKGAKVGEIQTPPRGKFVMVSDPDGNQIHIAEFNKDWVKKNNYSG